MGGGGYITNVYASRGLLRAIGALTKGDRLLLVTLGENKSIMNDEYGTGCR
jgi:hypothetical protein